MKAALLSFLLLSVITVYTPERASATDANRAVISGTLPEKQGKVYLLQDPLDIVDSGDIPVDSAVIDTSGFFSMKAKCSADSKYSLRTGERGILSDIFCKGGDSLVIQQKEVESQPNIVFDKGGATKLYIDFFMVNSFELTYFTKMQEKKWLECYAMLDKRTQSQASFLMMNTFLVSAYPALSRELEDAVRYGAISNKLDVLSYCYYDDNDSVLIQDKRATDFIDQLQFEPYKHELTNGYSGLIVSYLAFPFKRWKLAVMAANKLDKYDRLSLRFEFCKSHFTGWARDCGMFYAMFKLFLLENDSITFAVAKKQLQDFTRFATDKRFLRLATRLYTTKLAISAGQTAPDFTLQDINSRSVSLSDYRGKTVYLEFTGTWCGPCREEMPAMKELQKKCKDNPNIQFLAVWLEGKGDMASWAKFVRGTELGGDHLYSQNQFAGKVPQLYKVFGVPTFMIIDKSGKVVSSIAKRPSEEGIYEELTRIAGE